MLITAFLRAPSISWVRQRLTRSTTFLFVFFTFFSMSHVLGSPQITSGLRHNAYLGELGSNKMGLGMSSLLWPQESGGIVEHEEDSPVIEGGSVQEEGDILIRNRIADPQLRQNESNIENPLTTPKAPNTAAPSTAAPATKPPVTTDAPTPAPSNVTEASTPAPSNVTEASTPAPSNVTEASTPAPSNVTQAPTALPSPVPNTTVVVNSTDAPPTASALFNNANISIIYDRNYSYIDQTTFVSGMNGWDFEGIWLKSNLETMDEDARPVPLPHPPTRQRIEAGNSPGAALGGLGQDNGEGLTVVNVTNVTIPEYVNNYVIIDYSFLAGGALRKVFPAMDIGEVYLSYYVIDDSTSFKLTMESSSLSQPLLVYDDASANPRPVGEWVIRSFNFTANKSLDFALVLTVLPLTVPSEESRPVLAVHHIAVGGNLSDVIPTIPPGGSNATIIPPGAMEPIREIASAIWTALYVFLTFFLLSIVALVVLIMRGRCSQTGSASRDSDYNPDTSYRLDKVYDNPSYDASSP